LDEIGELGLDEQAVILRAIEEKRFLPLGSDKETMSDFQLIAGTNRDLPVDVAKGKFREDLLARLDLWTFELPALKDRRDDIEPNLDFELVRFAEREGVRATFNREARERYLAFARSDRAIWRANFRDLGASVIRSENPRHCQAEKSTRATVRISGAGSIRSVIVIYRMNIPQSPRRLVAKNCRLPVRAAFFGARALALLPFDRRCGDRRRGAGAESISSRFVEGVSRIDPWSVVVFSNIVDV
jgi:hypothetical protein